MDKIAKNQLEKLLKEWFLSEKGKVHQFTRDKVGLLIKNELEKEDRWKVMPRGNPRKGMEKYRFKQAIRNGYQPSERELEKFGMLKE